MTAGVAVDTPLCLSALVLKNTKTPRHQEKSISDYPS